MTTEPLKPPTGLRRSGRALWRAVSSEYELEEHEVTLLREACRTADSLDALQALLDTEGHMSTSSQGARVHPAIVELRQQRIAFARLLAALQIPSGEEAAQGKTHARAPRGVYGITGSVS